MKREADAPPFRDGSHGTEARREKLLGDRRADLAYMSHDIRRIYVARAGRLGMSVGLIVGGALLLAGTLSGSLASALTELLPGPAPATLANLLLATWLLAIATFLLARSIGERRFSLAMSRAVLPSEDAHRDVARLAQERPEEVGRRMTHKLGRKRVPLAAFAASLALPATAIMLLLAIDSRGYPRLASFEEAMPFLGREALGFAAMGASFALVRYYRPRRALYALGATTFLACLLAKSPWLAWGTLPLLALAWRIDRTHRREEAVLGAQGAPLPKPLHLRKRAAARLGQWSRAVREAQVRRVHILAAALVVIAAGALGLERTTSPDSAASMHAPAEAKIRTDKQNRSKTPDVETPPSTPVGSVQRLAGDGLSLLFDFENRERLSATSHLGGVAIPPGWRATVQAHKVDSSGAYYLQFFSPKVGLPPRHLAYDQGVLSVSHTNCSDAPIPLALTAVPYGSHEAGTSLSIRYEATLDFIGSCPQE